MVPVNLVNEISSVGFDYDLSPRDVASRVVIGGFPLWAHHFPLGPAGSGKEPHPHQRSNSGPWFGLPALPWLRFPQSWIRELHGKIITSDVGNGP